MARTKPRKTIAVHLDCADQPHSDAYTWREVLLVWTAPEAPRGVNGPNRRDQKMWETAMRRHREAHAHVGPLPQHPAEGCYSPAAA